MAITITDTPLGVSRVGQKLMILASSTNVAQPNFRYIVRFIDNSITIGEYILPPNPNNVLMFDLSEVAKSRITNPNIAVNQYGTKQITNDTDLFAFYNHDSPCLVYAISVLEGYDVSGVFTIDEESAVTANNDNGAPNFFTFVSSHKVIDGYKPSNDRYAYAYDAGIFGSAKLFMGGRKPNTNFPFAKVNLAPSSQRVFIPVRKSELDYGCMSYVVEKNQNYIDSTPNMFARMTLFESDGTPHTASSQIDVSDGDIYLANLQCYPANLNAHGDLIRPSDYADWRYYTIALFDDTDSNRVSAEYVFYPVEDDCKFENVRLAWWHPEIGGWDFFNFDKKNEESIQVERKRVKKVVGTYTETSFSFNTFDRELSEGMIDRVDYIDITSGWLQEGEFELLKSLIPSHAVYIVGDDGTLTPVLIEENSFTVRKLREAKLYNYSMKLRYSQQFM